MSCLDVMYQVLGGQNYFSYSPYQREKLSIYSKMQESQDGGSRRAPAAPPGPPSIKEEEKDVPPGAEYLSSRCVLFTYFQGDVGSVIDEHFSRALSYRRDGWFPMSQRSFPPSFWSSSYQPPAHADLSFAGDSYTSLHLHHPPGPEAWPPSHHHHHHHPYSLGGAIATQSSAYSHPGVHEMYGAAFDPRYGSLLVPSVRPHPRLAARGGAGGSQGGATETPGGKAESGVGSSWGGTFGGTGAELALNMDSGLQDKTKDLYWF